MQERVEELKAADALKWPRIKSDPHAVTVQEFVSRYKLKPGETRKDDYVLVRGMLAHEFWGGRRLMRGCFRENKEFSCCGKGTCLFGYCAG